MNFSRKETMKKRMEDRVKSEEEVTTKVVEENPDLVA